MNRLTTSRGFDAPKTLPETLDHNHEHYIIVRLTLYELRQVTGVSGKSMRLLRRDDGTYDAIRYPFPEGGVNDG